MRLSILWRIIEIEEVVIRAFSQSELEKYFEWIIISVNTALSGVNFKIIFLARKPHRNTRISEASFYRSPSPFPFLLLKEKDRIQDVDNGEESCQKLLGGQTSFQKTQHYNPFSWSLSIRAFFFVLIGYFYVSTNLVGKTSYGSNFSSILLFWLLQTEAQRGTVKLSCGSEHPNTR